MQPNFELAVGCLDQLATILSRAVAQNIPAEEASKDLGKVIRTVRGYVYGIPENKELTNFGMYRYTYKLHQESPEFFGNTQTLEDCLKPEYKSDLPYALYGLTNVVIMGILDTPDRTLDYDAVKELMESLVTHSCFGYIMQEDILRNEPNRIIIPLTEIFLSLKEIAIRAPKEIQGYGTTEVLYNAESYVNLEDTERSNVTIWTINKADLDKNIERFKNDS